MKLNKRPSKLVVLGHEIDVLWGTALLPSVSSEDYGQSDADGRWVAVATERCKTEAIVEATLLHELAHTVLGLSGVSAVLGDDKEEAVVMAMENGLYQVIVSLVELGFFKTKTLLPKA